MSDGNSFGFYNPPPDCTPAYREALSNHSDHCQTLVQRTATEVVRLRRETRCECLGRVVADSNSECIIQNGDYYSVTRDIEFCTSYLGERMPTVFPSTSPSFQPHQPSHPPVQISEEGSVADNSTTLYFLPNDEEEEPFPIAMLGLVFCFAILCVAGFVYKLFSKQKDLEEVKGVQKKNFTVKKNKARKSYEFYYEDDKEVSLETPAATSPVASSHDITLIERIDSPSEDDKEKASMPSENQLSLKDKSTSGRVRRKRSRRKTSHRKNDHRRNDTDRGRSRTASENRRSSTNRGRGRYESDYERSDSTKSDTRGSMGEKIGRLGRKAKNKVKGTTGALGRAIEKAASKAVFKELQSAPRKLKLGSAGSKRMKKKKKRKKSRNTSSIEREFSSGTSEGLGSTRSDSESSVGWRSSKKREKKTRCDSESSEDWRSIKRTDKKMKKIQSDAEERRPSISRKPFFKRASTLTELKNAVARFESSRGKQVLACSSPVGSPMKFAGIYEQDHEVTATLIDGKVQWRNGHTTAYKVKSNSRIAVTMPLNMGKITGILQNDGSLVFNEDMIWTKSRKVDFDSPTKGSNEGNAFEKHYSQKDKLLGLYE